MATTVLSPSTQQQQQQLHLSSPPADSNSTYSKFGSSHITSLPAYTDKTPRRASINRYSWSSASSNNSASSPTSPGDSNTASIPTRKFRLPVRVSTDLTSFASSDSSPQSRRRSLSLASNDSKRRSSQIPALKKVDEASKASDEKSASPQSPEKESRSKAQTPPPPPYKPVSDSKTPVAPSPSSQDIKPKESTPPPPPPATQSAPVVQKPVAPSPVKPQSPPAPREIPTTAPITKMSSAASSPDVQKAAVANPMTNRGLDFSVGNGNTKLTHQSEHGGSLPLPNLSGRGNGPVGNLLRGPVDEDGNLKPAALTVGIKLDLEAEVHLSARVRGDILVGLY